MLPAARVVSDMATSCNGLYALSHIPIPPLPQAQIAEGAQTIRINGLLAARVSSKLTCGASIQRGALNVYLGGPTKRVLAVSDLESMLLSGLAFTAKASLLAMAVLTIPLGGGAMATFAAVFGGFTAVNYGLGRLGNQIGPGWSDILQGGFGLTAILGGSVLGAKALEQGKPGPEAENAAADVVPSQIDAENLAQTGAGKFSRSADEAYDAIRASTADVPSIAENTGFSEENIQNVKDHLFNNEHLLDRYVDQGIPATMGRFDSDASIAESWSRLENGTFTDQDIQLLKHETAEAWYMQKYGPSYNAAHEAAQARFPAPNF
jgi:hypothetical protein